MTTDESFKYLKEVIVPDKAAGLDWDKLSAARSLIFEDPSTAYKYAKEIVKGRATSVED